MTPLVFGGKRDLVICNLWSINQPVVRLHPISCVCDESSWVEHSTFILCGARLCFLKETESRRSPFAVTQTYTICACPVTLSSSSNIQTSFQFKLAGHGPVTYFPHNMLCNIREEAMCHQLTNLHHSIVSAKRWKKKKKITDTNQSYMSGQKCLQGPMLSLYLKVK